MVQSIVSWETSPQKELLLSLVTVIHTPLQAIESPIFTSEKSKLDDEIFIVDPLPLGVISSKKPIA